MAVGRRGALPSDADGRAGDDGVFILDARASTESHVGMVVQHVCLARCWTTLNAIDGARNRCSFVNGSDGALIGVGDEELKYLFREGYTSRPIGGSDDLAFGFCEVQCIHKFVSEGELAPYPLVGLLQIVQRVGDPMNRRLEIIYQRMIGDGRDGFSGLSRIQCPHRAIDGMGELLLFCGLIS